MNAAGTIKGLGLRGWVGLQGFSQRPEDRETLEEAVERAADREELLSEAMRIAGVGGWELDLATGTLSWSDETFRIFGFEPGSCQPSNELFYSLVQEEDRDRMLRQQDRSSETGQIFDEEYRIVRPSGEVRYLNSRAQIVPRGKDRTNRFLGIVRDITEQKLLQQKLDAEKAASERAQADLIHLSRVNAMGTMASAMAHELNQPLTSIMNYTAGLTRALSSGAAPEGISAAIQEINKAAHRASEIIRRLRSRTSRGEVRKEAVRLKDCVAEASQMALAGTHLAVINHVPGSLVVTADRIQLHQVFVNLLRNAAEAVEESANGRLEVNAVAEGPNVRIDVADNGPGISADLLPTIFDSFMSTKTEGMGIGLAISRTIIEAHEGTLTAESMPGQGSTFTIRLPAYETAPSGKSMSASSAGPHSVS